MVCVNILLSFLAEDTESSESGKLSETHEVAQHLSRTRLVCEEDYNEFLDSQNSQILWLFQSNFNNLNYYYFHQTKTH